MEPTVKRESKLRAIIEGALYFGSAFLLALIIQTYIARPFIVNGQSMDPTFKNGDYLIIDEISYKFHEPERGDVVVFKAPPTPDKYYIKRIIGLPGEKVQIENGTITIFNDEHKDGMVVDFTIKHPKGEVFTTIVPEDHYFVMGDNRAGSYDSRAWGSLPKENLRGRALVRLLPFNEIGLFPGGVNVAQ